MSEIQVQTRVTESMRLTMEMMAVGNFFMKPLENWATLRSYASTLKKYTGNEYEVNRVGDEVRVTRTA